MLLGHLFSEDQISSQPYNWKYSMPIVLVSEVMGHLIGLSCQLPPRPNTSLFAQRIQNSNKLSHLQ